MQIQRHSRQRYSATVLNFAIADHFGSFPWPCFAIPFQRRAKLVKAFSSHTQQRPSVTLLIQGISKLFRYRAMLLHHVSKPIQTIPLPLIAVPSCSHTNQSYPFSTLCQTSAHHCFPSTILCCSEAGAKRHFACTGHFIAFAVLYHAYALAFNATQLHHISVRFLSHPYRCPRLSAQFHRIDNHRSSCASLFLANALLNRTFSKLR